MKWRIWIMSPSCVCIWKTKLLCYERYSVSEFLSKRVDFKEMRIGRETFQCFIVHIRSVASFNIQSILSCLTLILCIEYQPLVPIELWKGTSSSGLGRTTSTRDVLIGCSEESLQTNNGNDSPFSLPRFLLLIRHWLQRIMDGQCVVLLFSVVQLLLFVFVTVLLWREWDCCSLFQEEERRANDARFKIQIINSMSLWIN